MPEAPVPLRLGVLGAARITPLSLLAPAAVTGDQVVAVAARDPLRATEFAAEHRIERAVDTYAEVLAAADVEAVYNPLPNGLHAIWNARVAQAGKHVLAEKPAAANAAAAEAMAHVVRESGVAYLEAFHFPYHPLFQRVCALLEQGAIGDIVHIDVPLLMPDPGVNDPRWSFEMAGGATMDLGCYSLACLALLGERFCGGPPAIESATATERLGRPGVDSQLFFSGRFPCGATASGGSDMDASDWSFTLVITGTEGEIVVPAFPLPHQDDRLILRRPASAPRARRTPAEAADLVSERPGDTVEHLGQRSSYTYQLEAFAAAIRQGQQPVTGIDFSVANARLIDDVYAAAGLPSRVAAAP